MVKATTNWESVETWQRLVSSILATGYKPDLRATATYFGTTYDTLENRFHKLKKEAETLKAERGEVTTPSRTKSAPATTRKPKTPKKESIETVTNGRVAKKTPSKKTAIKHEQSDSDASGSFNDVQEAADDHDAMAMNVNDDFFAGGMSMGGFEFK